MVKSVVFDFDGTLVDSKDISIEAINVISDRHGFKRIVPEEIDELMKLTMKERCKALNVSFYKIPFYAVEFYTIYKQFIKKMKFFDGMKELLFSLKEKGYHIAVISSNSEKNIREFFEHNQVDFLQDIFCSNDVMGKDKILNRFMKDFKRESHEIIYVGDESRDIKACKSSGVKVIWASWGYDDYEVIKKFNPDYLAEKPEDIMRHVASA